MAFEMRLFSIVASALLVIAALPVATPANAKTPIKTPEIFILGDSQISFGAGEPLLDLFENLSTYCADHWRKPNGLTARLADRSVGVMGVRSTSIHSWTQRKGRAKRLICEKDKTWGVNAGVYGALRSRKSKYEQVGERPHSQFCKPNRAAFDVMFDNGYYMPKLFVMFFLGNSSGRWRGNAKAALEDARRLSAQLPAGMPCVFMTTAPTHKPSVNRDRAAAQRAIAAALHATGERCVLVEGITKETRRAFEGMPQFFFRRKSRSVRDPFHPNKAGASYFLRAQTPKICRAIERAMRISGDI